MQHFLCPGAVGNLNQGRDPIDAVQAAVPDGLPAEHIIAKEFGKPTVDLAQLDGRNYLLTNICSLWAAEARSLAFVSDSHDPRADSEHRRFRLRIQQLRGAFVGR